MVPFSSVDPDIYFCSTEPSFIRVRFHHVEVSQPSCNQVHVIYLVVLTFKVTLATGHVINLNLNHTSQTLS